MRIFTLLFPVSLLILTAAAPAALPGVDPNSDFDCATAYKYAYKMSVAKNLEADVQQQTLLMNKWFATNIRDKLPPTKEQLLDHFSKVLDAMVNDPKGAIDTLKSCSARANADPAFGAFLILHGKDASPPR